jgi:hypothetical protein
MFWKKYLAVLLLSVLLVGQPRGPHSSSNSSMVAGQGLDVSADNLGAGAEDTANEFELCESALELATTGGRGRYEQGLAASPLVGSCIATELRLNVPMHQAGLWRYVLCMWREALP